MSPKFAQQKGHRIAVSQSHYFSFISELAFCWASFFLRTSSARASARSRFSLAFLSMEYHHRNAQKETKKAAPIRIQK